MQAALTHHGHQGQCLLLQLALDSLGNVLDVRQGEVLKQLWAQVPCMGLKQLERLPGRQNPLGWKKLLRLLSHDH